MRAWAAALALLTGMAGAAEPEVKSITWLAGDTLAVLRGGGAERPSDHMINWLTKRLPEVEQLRVTANAKRSWALIERGERVCHAGAVRQPEREKLAYFSNTRLTPPLRLIVRADRRHDLPMDATGQVDLGALLADTRWRGVMVHGRSYGPQIDALLARRPQGGMKEVTAGDFGSNLATMVLHARADYAVDYPNLLAALAEKRPEMAQLVMLPIGGVSDPIVSGVACPRTPWGRAAIRLIDRELGTPEGAAMLREALLAQMPAETARQYRDQIDAFYQRRAAPTPGL